MRLYPRQGQSAITDPEYGDFEPGPDGGFDLPEDLAERLVRFHVGKQPLWETDIQRQNRLALEEVERRKDPATLLDAVQQLVAAAQSTQPLTAPAQPAKATRAKKAAPPPTA